MNSNTTHYFNKNTACIIIIVGLLLIGGYATYKNISLNKDIEFQKNEFSAQSSFLNLKLQELETDLSNVTTEKMQLSEILETEKKKNDVFERQINKISGKVGTLEKLSKTDPELLQKYSKVYFLNEHYIPSKLTVIDDEYVFNNKEKTLEIHADVAPQLEKLLVEAKKDNAPLQIISAYRSFDTQATLKSNYKITYGAGTANQFSADQGYSEHQLGTAIDFTTPVLGASFSTGFEKTEAYAWLTENAHRFGFILSYPKNNAYYQYEPWHWRYVGKDLARKLHREGKNFYDLEQREIDEYLVDLFD